MMRLTRVILYLSFYCLAHSSPLGEFRPRQNTNTTAISTNTDSTTNSQTLPNSSVASTNLDASMTQSSSSSNNSSMTTTNSDQSTSSDISPIQTSSAETSQRTSDQPTSLQSTESSGSPSQASSTLLSSEGGVSTTVVTFPDNTVTTITVPPEVNSPWPTFDLPPEPTITGEPDKEVGNLTSLLFALRNRRSLFWTDRKDEFVKGVEDTESGLVGFLGKIPNPPEADPACSNSKKKRDVLHRSHNLYRRGFLDGAIDTLKDVASTVACAVKVASNLADKVKIRDPPSIEIENLTEALEQLGKKMEEQKDKPDDPSRTSNEPSSTDSSSSSSCSATVASSCSISCVAGSTSSCTTTCSTFTGCSVTNTATATTLTPPGKETPPPFAVVEVHVDTFWYLEDVPMSDEDIEKLYSSMESFMNEAPDGTTTGEPIPSQTSKPELVDHCADTTVYTAFDYATAEKDIQDFCRDGRDLTASPVWNTYGHSDMGLKLHLAVQWSNDGQDGCNPPEGDFWHKIGQEDCEARFMESMNRCNKENDLTQKYGNYPMVWSGPQGCIDFWLVGHDSDWACDNMNVSPLECTVPVYPGLIK